MQGEGGDLSPYGAAPPATANLAEILERVLDKGIVIAGDIRIDLLDIELLTIKIRLLVASVDKARELGIDWWEHDPTLSSKAVPSSLEERLARLESAAGIEPGEDGAGDEDEARAPLESAAGIEPGDDGAGDEDEARARLDVRERG